MKNYLVGNEWSIIEDAFHPHYNRISESIFSLGNGNMGQRANFEEQFSGETLQGNYVAGVYYPDKTKVGWWKNGYPEYFAKVLNAMEWTGIHFHIEGQPVDLAKCEVKDFSRELNMKEGYLDRRFIAKLPNGFEIKVNARRFLSIAEPELAALKYSITPLNFYGKITFVLPLDFDVKNADSNYEEKFWEEVSREVHDGLIILTAKTKKTDFHVSAGIRFDVFQNHKQETISVQKHEKEKYADYSFFINGIQDEEITIYKYAAVVSSLNYSKDELQNVCKERVNAAIRKGFNSLFDDHKNAWATKWEESDIKIEGDIKAQQAIRFNIFQLNQTYTGRDERLNIGPKGFTGEKYGGSTYWDTEAYCLPFYLSTADEKVSRNLLVYRYKHLSKAIENAEKLGFKGGAALFPMVTMNGEECHNEWEITFEEIHRNGAIAYAIFNYIRYTGDTTYLLEFGLEVLIGIARFWSQRVNFSEEKKKFVMLGVTGPNEYENNVNNNWYTNLLAQWCLRYALETLSTVKSENTGRYQEIIEKTIFREAEETKSWRNIIENIYLPENKDLGIFLQQEGYMDKEQILVKDLDPVNLPLNQKWSWDRILRSCFIKQADVLQGLFFFEHEFDLETIKRNFEFYEPRTVHESSLSPCVHSILAARIGDTEKAYEMYLRTARLDLDDYNNDTEDGCHITSMAGTWMSVVYGFGGLQIINEQLHLSPFIPPQWKGFSFKLRFRNTLLKIRVEKDQTIIENLSSQALKMNISGKEYLIEGNDKTEITTEAQRAIN